MPECPLETRARLAIRSKTPEHIAAVFIGGHSWSGQVAVEFAARPQEFAEPVRQALLLIDNTDDMISASSCLADTFKGIYESAAIRNPIYPVDEPTYLRRLVEADAHLAAFSPCIASTAHIWNEKKQPVPSDRVFDLMRYAFTIMHIVEYPPEPVIAMPQFSLALAQAVNEAPQAFRNALMRHNNQWTSIPPSATLALAASLRATREAEAIDDSLPSYAKATRRNAQSL
jgi:pimeloyl-ACP methyl ester carboxylesterase